MNKMKRLIIHLLGGYTEEDFDEIVDKNYEIGKKVASREIKTYLDLINGTPADEWCKLAYMYVCRKAGSDDIRKEI